jgi:pimeloyl-ACP methyl ester carboxylesterase
MPIARVDDIDINYEITDFTDPWTKPETILLHHGFMRNLRFWYQWVPLLCRDYRVLTMDARGAGQTTIPAESYKFTRDQMGDDAVGLMDALGVERVHWGAEGQGGIVGINVGARYPDRLASLTLCNTPIKTPQASRNTFEEQNVWEHGVAHWARQTAAWRFDVDKLPAGFLEWSIAEAGRMPPHIARAPADMKGTTDGRDILKDLKAPTLVLAGESSKVASLDQVREMEALIPQAEVVVFEGYSQGIAYSNAEACAAHMLQFLKRLPKRN